MTQRCVHTNGCEWWQVFRRDEDVSAHLLLSVLLRLSRFCRSVSQVVLWCWRVIFRPFLSLTRTEEHRTEDTYLQPGAARSEVCTPTERRHLNWPSLNLFYIHLWFFLAVFVLILKAEAGRRLHISFSHTPACICCPLVLCLSVLHVVSVDTQIR